MEIFDHTLNNEMNAGIITAKGVGSHTSKQGRVRALSSFDTQVGQNAIGQNLLTNCVPKIKTIDLVRKHVINWKSSAMQARLAHVIRRLHTSQIKVINYFTCYRSWGQVSCCSCSTEFQ